MKLAVSNIAWERHDDPSVLAMLQKSGVTGIEIAPTKIWPNWEGATVSAATDYRNRIMDLGFRIPALQAILFGRPNLQLFEPESHPALIEHLKRVADLAAALGAHVVVFGSPKNRRRGQLSYTEATELAALLFSELGEHYAARGCCIGLEHNPLEYGCDFVTSAADAREFVDRVDSKGFALHLDSGGLHLSGGDIATPIRALQPCAHYHASEPMLDPLAGGVVNHASGFRALREVGYNGWVSIEMKQPRNDVVEVLRRSIEIAKRDFGEKNHDPAYA